MKPWRAAPACLLLLLLRCRCDAPEGGPFGCGTRSDCARGFFCLRGQCVPDGTPPPEPDAGPPPFRAALRFTTPARTTAAGACSPELAFDFIDDAGAEVTPPAELQVSVSASGLLLFSDSACVTALRTASADAGFFFRGLQPGTFDVTLSAERCDPATQQQTVVPAGMNRLLFAAPPAPRLAGSCVALRVEERDPAGAPAGDGGTQVTLSAAPAGLRFYAAPDCSGAPDASVTAGSDFGATSETGRNYVVTATAANLTGDQTVVPLRPLVHSGTCSLAAGELVKSCAVTPPQLEVGRTFLVYQASSAQHDPERSTVTCVLADAGSVSCQRLVATGTANVTWQTAELAGARVDRYEAACNPDGGDFVTVPLGAAIPPASTFVLTASNAFGMDLNGNDTFSVTASATQLELRWGGGCNARRVHLQTVQVPGFSVERASGALAGVLGGGAAGLPAPDGGTFALATWRSSAPNNENRLCDRMLRASLPDSAQVAVSRGLGNPASQCVEFDVPAWSVQRVDVGPRGAVQQLGLTLDAGVSSALRGIGAIDLTRTLVLASGQTGGAGQAVGEGFSPDDGGGFLGEVAATLRLISETELRLERTSAREAASFTVYLIELNP